MTLKELRDKIGEKHYFIVPSCNKIHLDMDRQIIDIGIKVKESGGMRMMYDSEPRCFLEFEELLDGSSLYIKSDGSFENACISAGDIIPLAIDIDDFELNMTSKIEKELKEEISYWLSEKAA